MDKQIYTIHMNRLKDAQPRTNIEKFKSIWGIVCYEPDEMIISMVDEFILEDVPLKGSNVRRFMYSWRARQKIDNSQREIPFHKLTKIDEFYEEVIDVDESKGMVSISREDLKRGFELEDKMMYESESSSDPFDTLDENSDIIL